MATTSEECLWKARFRLGVGKLSLCGKFVIYLYFNSELVSVFIFLAMRVKAHWHWELRSEVSWKLNILPNEYELLNFFQWVQNIVPSKKSTARWLLHVRFISRAAYDLAKCCWLTLQRSETGGFETGGMLDPCVDPILVSFGWAKGASFS